MTDSNICIKDEIISFIEIYKTGDIYQQKIALEIEELVKSKSCFFCLDEKQCWNYRGQKFKGDNKGEFYIKKCPRCLTIHNEHPWIKDCISTTDLVGPFGIQLFRDDATAGSDKFEALEKYVIQKNPELVKPDFTKSNATSIHRKKKTYNFDLEIGNILTSCKEVIDAYMGNIQSTLKLLADINLHISSVVEESNENKLLCEEINSNQFMYIAIKNHSTQKKKSILGIYTCQKSYLDIQIDIFEIKTLNDSAHHLCNKIVNKSAEKNINEMMKLFE